ncbi:MAG: ABC transporter permease [Clostridium sp.]|nr:ABC transporter permease [Clostridium sp.]
MLDLDLFLSSMPGAIAQGAIWGLMAIGLYISYKILDFADLSVDGSFTTGGAVFVISALNGINIYVAMIFAFLAGCIAGLATGIFNTKFGIPPILAGILTQLGLYSINLRIIGQDFSITGLDVKALEAIPRGLYTPIISSMYTARSLASLFIILALIIVVLYWFFGTELGHSIRATGSNRNMAKANGINIDRTTIIALVLSNGIVALSGAAFAQYQGSAEVSMGQGAIVIGLAAIIIGEVLFSKIFRNFALKLLGAGLGGVVYYIVIQTVVDIGFNTNDMKILTALVVALFLGIPYWKSHVDQKKAGSSKAKNTKEVKG